MTREVPLVVGTAGHIDHGKTTLVKALTGVDLDSREEEKRRGITIELGFTPLELPDGRMISLVDVPGHERLIRQMVAGASGLDAVILVVAADEGVMPQTREHLDILSLLGVERGLVALTKADAVDREMLALARNDVADFVSGTFLEGAPVVVLSSLTGEGLDELRQQLALLTRSLKPRASDGAYFMPVDRVFPVAGFGTVVTGTSLRGQIAPGEALDLLPAGKSTKVRSLQVHGQPAERAYAGQRTALCLSDIALDQVKRGDVVAAAGVFKPTDCLDVRLKLLPGETKGITHWQRVRLHIGTSDLLAHVALLSDKKAQGGQEVPAQLVLEEPIAAALGSRFVLRFYSPLRTIGGGVVTNPYGRKPGNRTARLQKAEQIEARAVLTSPYERMCSVVNDLGLVSLHDLAVLMQVNVGDLRGLVNTLSQKGAGRYLALGEGWVLSAPDEFRWLRALKGELEIFHAAYPHRPGMAADELAVKLWPESRRRLGRRLIDCWIEQGALKGREGLLALPDFEPVDGEAFERDKGTLKAVCDRSGFTPPTLDELRFQLGWSEKKFADVVDQLKKSGDVALLDGTFLVTKEQLDKLIGLVAGVQGGFGLADVKVLTGASRKYTMPMMEHLDRKGITRRVGDKRLVLRRNG